MQKRRFHGAFGGIIMSGREQGPYDSIARRWLALIERRQDHFIELSDSGRWRHYYNEAEFLDELRKLQRVRNHWAKLAGVPPEDWGVPFGGPDWSPRRRNKPVRVPDPLWPD
jgi:uncharacterized repeat protein (TIGR03809 family)